MEALAASPDVFETFFEQARIGLALADLSTHYVRVNDTYATLLGRPPEDLIGVSFTEVLHPDDRAGEDHRTDQLLTGATQSLQAEQRYVQPDGWATWVLHGVTVVPDAAGRPAWFAVSAHDITERRRAEQELRELTAVLTEQAIRDPLTGLANRALLEERLRAALSRDSRGGTSSGLLFLDLDAFKPVNDEHGHGVGDAVLRIVADRLRGVVRPSDTVARLGGDEFVVLVENADPAGLAALADRLHHALAAPVRFEGLVLPVGVSIGTALGEAGGVDPGGLLASADAAMYRHKRAAQGSVTLPRPSSSS